MDCRLVRVSVKKLNILHRKVGNGVLTMNEVEKESVIGHYNASLVYEKPMSRKHYGWT